VALPEAQNPRASWLRHDFYRCQQSQRDSEGERTIRWLALTRAHFDDPLRERRAFCVSFRHTAAAMI
jgi:hypothetical protein